MSTVKVQSKLDFLWYRTCYSHIFIKSAYLWSSYVSVRERLHCPSKLLWSSWSSILSIVMLTTLTFLSVYGLVDHVDLLICLNSCWPLLPSHLSRAVLTMLIFLFICHSSNFRTMFVWDQCWDICTVSVDPPPPPLNPWPCLYDVAP